VHFFVTPDYVFIENQLASLMSRASRERERERACERAGELARSLAKNSKLPSSRSLARRKIEVVQLALARSRKFLPIFCTLVVRVWKISNDHVCVFSDFYLFKKNGRFLESKTYLKRL
jgi:hypothetical protein